MNLPAVPALVTKSGFNVHGASCRGKGGEGGKKEEGGAHLFNGHWVQTTACCQGVSVYTSLARVLYIGVGKYERGLQEKAFSTI